MFSIFFLFFCLGGIMWGPINDFLHALSGRNRWLVWNNSSLEWQPCQEEEELQWALRASLEEAQRCIGYQRKFTFFFFWGFTFTILPNTSHTHRYIYMYTSFFSHTFSHIFSTQEIETIGWSKMIHGSTWGVAELKLGIRILKAQQRMEESYGRFMGKCMGNSSLFTR